MARINVTLMAKKVSENEFFGYITIGKSTIYLKYNTATDKVYLRLDGGKWVFKASSNDAKLDNNITVKQVIVSRIYKHGDQVIMAFRLFCDVK